MASSSLNTLLKSLTRVGRADSVYQVASADRINAMQDAIRLLVRGENIIAGSNVLKRSSDGYVVLTGNAGGRAGSSSSFLEPFTVIDATVTGGLIEGPGTHLKVFIVDGKVNGEYPSGMGFGNYILPIVEETYQQVFLLITFDPISLAILSRDIGLSDFPPSSGVAAGVAVGTGPTGPSIGTLIIPLADIIVSYTAGDPSVPYISLISQFNEGNIVFQFVYGALNGVPALLPLHAYANWFPVDPPAATGPTGP